MASSSNKENKSDQASAVASNNMDSTSSRSSHRERKPKVVDIMGRRKKAGRTKLMILFLHPHLPLVCSKAFVQTYLCVFLAPCRLYIVRRHSQPFLDLKEIIYHAFSFTGKFFGQDPSSSFSGTTHNQAPTFNEDAESFPWSRALRLQDRAAQTKVTSHRVVHFDDDEKLREYLNDSTYKKMSGCVTSSLPCVLFGTT